MTSPVRVTRTNTILYCARWADTVAFYRDALGLTVTHETDWFVEFGVAGTGHLSVADAARATVAPGHGRGVTLSWQVADLRDVRAALVDRGVAVSDVATRWGTRYVELHDPEGNRIELWTPGPD